MFPNYKTIKKRFLFWTYDKKVKDEWEDLGICENVLESRGGCITSNRCYCKDCCGIIHVAKEKNKTFRYCERCFKKIRSEDDEFCRVFKYYY